MQDKLINRWYGLPCWIFLLASCSYAQENVVPSSIATDETVQFFRTVASFDETTNKWRVPIHGWIYEPQQSRFRKALFSKTVQLKYGLKIDAANSVFYDRRINLLIADNERGKNIVIHLAGQQFSLPSSAPNGHFIDEILLDDTFVEPNLHNKLLSYYCKSEDGREFHGQVQFLPPDGLSIISDIDDTVKISDVLDHRRLIDNTFLQAFAPVLGMNTRYQQLSQQTNEPVSGFHFVSSSPWQLYAPLVEFLRDADFPWATLSLKAIRFRDMTLFDLFKPGTATKPDQIRAILDRFPRRQFVLIGDSGEQDPEVYAEIARAYPAQIRHIFIRNITGETLDNNRFKALQSGDTSWRLFTDPIQIQL